MLAARDLRLAFRRQTVLDTCDLAVPQGRCVGLVAPNGVGKTTLLNALAGLRVPGSFSALEADGVPVTERAAFRRAVFLAPGDGSLLYPDLTAEQHLRLLARFWGRDLDVPAAIGRFGLAAYGAKRVRSYSQGMRQSLVLALAFSSGARYLLLDEPLNALDPGRCEEAEGWVRDAVAEGCGVVVSSHLLDSQDRVADVLWLMADGAVTEAAMGDGAARLQYRRAFGCGEGPAGDRAAEAGGPSGGDVRPEGPTPAPRRPRHLRPGA